MKLHINQESQIRNIQNDFSKVYPFLKVEFFKEPIKKRPGQKGEEINPDQSVKLVGQLNGRNKIDISEQRTVVQLEEDFKEFFGLNAGVYRKAGDSWVQIHLTNEWTLEQQNKEGEFISTHT